MKTFRNTQNILHCHNEKNDMGILIKLHIFENNRKLAETKSS